MHLRKLDALYSVYVDVCSVRFAFIGDRNVIIGLKINIAFGTVDHLNAVYFDALCVAVAVLQEEVVDFLELEQDFFAEDLQEDLLFSWSTAIAQNSWSLPDGQPLFCQRK